MIEYTVIYQVERFHTWWNSKLIIKIEQKPNTRVTRSQLYKEAYKLDLWKIRKLEVISSKKIV